MNEICEQVIGKTYDEAKQICEEQKFTQRVVEEDGVSFIVTCDLRLDRVNLYINEGKVFKANIG